MTLSAACFPVEGKRSFETTPFKNIDIRYSQTKKELNSHYETVGGDLGPSESLEPPSSIPQAHSRASPCATNF
ncbi:hypothetical protein EVAR_80616_1 [Eumeta japonica]|uniref:Uncharacterized protein n=1 Tax=Eumeta variegata TaxID=151549 RepID=A0A4C2A136_EUMVA|nr:hypothetical protein EVAR_80616_1 [Eumeta japonica]